jgi:hypothetical protein
VAIRRFSTADLTGRKGSSMVGGYGWGWSEMDSIQTVAMGDTPSITFSNLGLGGVYQHLQLRAVLFGATAGMAVVMRFNGVSTANYHSHVLRGTGSAASGGASTGRTSLLLHDDHTNTTNPCALVCDILDYSSTVKTKTIRSLFGYDNNGSGQVGLYSGFYNSTDAITSITLIDAYGGNIRSGGRFALYGIKG